MDYLRALQDRLRRDRDQARRNPVATAQRDAGASTPMGGGAAVQQIHNTISERETKQKRDGDRPTLDQKTLDAIEKTKKWGSSPYD